MTLACSFQRQSPPGGVLSKMCSDKVREIHKKHLRWLFLSKVAGQLCNFTEKGRHFRCLSVILTNISLSHTYRFIMSGFHCLIKM